MAKRGRNGGFTLKQDRALDGLMEMPTLEGAARLAGVGSRTVYRWLREDEAFREAYLARRREAMSQAITQLQQAAGEAVATLRVVMADSELPANARVSAASKCLELAIKGLETLDLERRIGALEKGRHVNGQGRQWT